MNSFPTYRERLLAANRENIAATISLTTELQANLKRKNDVFAREIEFKIDFDSRRPSAKSCVHNTDCSQFATKKT